MMRSTLLLPKGIEKLIASCWVLKGKCTFFFLTKENYKSSCCCWLTQMSAPLCLCCAGGRGQLQSLLQKPCLWDRIIQSHGASHPKGFSFHLKEDAVLVSSHLITNQDKFLSSSAPPQLFCNPSKTSCLVRKRKTHCFHQACTDLFALDHCISGKSKRNLCSIREELAIGGKKTREGWCPVPQGNLILFREEVLFS